LRLALAAALDGSGPAVLPVEQGAARGSATTRGGVPDGTVPDGVALVVATSGSTGAPREVLLSADALRASGEATATRLGGHGHWLLALPAVHVAGAQVLVRSLLAGTEPVVLAPGPFRTDAFTAAVDELVARTPHPGARRYASLVPTQVHRLLATDDGARALRVLDAVLVGGAASAPALLDDARAAGVHVVTTYGMSETCGGCVYDGVPLDGVDVALDDDGRVLLAGPVLAQGYRDRPDLDADAFMTRGGRRWLRTGDLGELAPARAGEPARLRVLGRADDVLVTGGAKVAPAEVERVLAAMPPIAEVCVVGVPDPEWGQSVTAVVVLRAGAALPPATEIRAAVTRSLGRAAAPRQVVVVDELPLRGPGKPDRVEVARLAVVVLGT
jgi:O-succinylbenzoic acid--CoA ligase